MIRDIVRFILTIMNLSEIHNKGKQIRLSGQALSELPYGRISNIVAFF